MRRAVSLGLMGVALAVACGGAGDETPQARRDSEVEELVDALAADEQPARAEPALSERQLDELRAAVASAPDDPVVRRRLARGLHDAGVRAESIEHFEKLVQLDDRPRSLLELGIAYASVSRLNEAEATYRRLLERSPGFPIALHNLANIALKRGRTDEAIELYRQAIAGDPGYLLAHYHLGGALTQAGQYREAYKVFEKVVLDLEPSNASELEAIDDSLYRMASLDITMGAYERAGQLLTELLRQNPKHPAAHYAYGQVLMHFGREEEAQRAFENHMRLLAEQRPRGPAAMGE